VGSTLGDRPAQAPPPQLWVAQRAHGLPFGGTMGSGRGYGGFQPLEQFNAGMGTGMMPPAVAPHMNPAFLAAGGIAMRGPGVWPDQAMDVGFWGAQPQWNFRGCQLPWHRPAPTMQAQQQHGEGEYGKILGMSRGRPGRSDGMGIGNVRSHPERRQSDHDGGDLYKEHDREERSGHGERVPKKEREPERQWDDGDRCRGDKRRYQEYTDDDDNNDRRVWARARSQSRNDVYDDHPRWRL
jgi:cleavage and polyadenylation specificity factor subunit 6/7